MTNSVLFGESGISEEVLRQTTEVLQQRATELGMKDNVTSEQATLYRELVQVIGTTSVGPFFTIIPTARERQVQQVGASIALTDYVLAEPLVSPATTIDSDPAVYRAVNGQVLTIDTQGKVWFPNLNIRSKLVPRK